MYTLLGQKQFTKKTTKICCLSKVLRFFRIPWKQVTSPFSFLLSPRNHLIYGLPNLSMIRGHLHQLSLYKVTFWGLSCCGHYIEHTFILFSSRYSFLGTQPSFVDVFLMLRHTHNSQYCLKIWSRGSNISIWLYVRY